jgi:uncharacterized protein
MRKFLTAEWRDLIMANYEVDPSLLADRIPAETTLDLHEGRCFVSIVGFMFLNTRVLEFLIPFHINFEEVNLRFYVKREIEGEVRRGVCFIKEIVPRAAIATVARVVYGEPYERYTMRNDRSEDHVEYAWERDEVRSKISTALGENLGVPESGSHGEFIIEHYWGYTKRSDERTDEFKVEHPKWELREVVSSEIDVDFARVYGSEFGFLSDRRPDSVVFACGSEIAVYKGARLQANLTADDANDADERRI